jgi:ribosome maturation factor RimP
MGLNGVGLGPAFLFFRVSFWGAALSREAKIEAIITEPLEAMGYELVRVLFAGKSRPTLQVMAERKDEQPMTVDDCADISRAISPLLDVADPIAGAYVLEVSSPGLDRPLIKRKDFERWAGYEARIETAEPVEGRRRFKGKLLGVGEGQDGVEVRVMVEDAGEIAIPLPLIERAKLVLTDELIAGVLKQQGQQ